MKKRITNGLVIMATCIMACTSCTEDVDLKNISPEIGIDMGIALPIGTASVTLGDFLSGGKSEIASILPYIGIESNGSLYAKYQYEYTPTFHPIKLTENQTVADENFRLEATANSLWQASDFPVTINAGESYTMDFDVPITITSINDNTTYERIDSVKITEASFTSNFTVGGGLNMDYDEIESVDVILPNNFKYIDKTLHIALNKGYGQDHEIKMNNFMLSMVGSDNKPTRNVNVKFRITMKAKQNKTINLGAEFAYKFIINFIDYEILYGYFDTDGNLDKDTLSLKDIAALKAIEDMVLPFTNPKVDVTTTTNIGVPMVFNINYAKAIDSKGQTIDMIFSNTHSTNSIININVPTIPYDSAKTYITFDKNNGQIDKLFTIFPENLYWDVKTIVDRNSRNHFMLKNPYLRINIDVKVPLEFNPGVDIAYSDTIKNISIATEDIENYQVNELDSTSYALVTLKAFNGLPFDIDAVFEFLDENNAPLKLLANGNTLHIPAATDTYTENGEIFHKLAEPNEPILISAKGNDIQSITKLKAIAFKATVSTDKAGSQHAELLKSDKLKLAVSLAAKANMTLNLDSIK